VSWFVLVILSLVPFGHPLDRDVPSGFPVNDCDCLIEFNAAAGVVDFVGSKTLMPILLETLVGMKPGGSGQLRALLDDPRVSSRIFKRSVVGLRKPGSENELEWIAWVPIGPDGIAGLMSELRPVRKVDRLVIPRINVSVARSGSGMLLASEPPGSLRTQALAMIGSGSESLPWATSDAPLQVTFRNDDFGTGLWFGRPGASRVSMRPLDQGVQLEYSGWTRDGMPRKPCCERLLDLSVLDKMPKNLIGVFVELPDSQVLPGAGFLEELFPYVVDSERSDERWSRRMVVLGEMTSGDETTVPTLAVAIESDGPGSTLRRQDISVLAALNSLRNRLGSKAGLQHLPKLNELPKSGPRTIYARAMFDPVMAGHPFLKDISINWCRTKGATDWELYATCPSLTSQLSGFFQELPATTQCVSASHVGRINSRKLAEHLLSLRELAPEFVNGLEIPLFKAGVGIAYDLLKKTETIDWVVSIPGNGRVEATVTILPRQEDGIQVD
tara:strand:+ start:1212 stop:2708 length:1497 start_codon:yes stop_codon:yes gene_type:complete